MPWANCRSYGRARRRAAAPSAHAPRCTRATSAGDAASNNYMSCCFVLPPRRDQVPERRIFEAQAPDADPLQAVLVHQRQLAPQGVRTLYPELVVHTVDVVAEMHLLLDLIESGRRAITLRDDHHVFIRARDQACDARPIGVVGWKDESRLL